MIFRGLEPHTHPPPPPFLLARLPGAGSSNGRVNARVDGAAADAHIRRRARTAAAGAAGAPTGFAYSFSQ